MELFGVTVLVSTTTRIFLETLALTCAWSYPVRSPGIVPQPRPLTPTLLNLLGSRPLGSNVFFKNHLTINIMNNKRRASRYIQSRSSRSLESFLRSKGCPQPNGDRPIPERHALRKPRLHSCRRSPRYLPAGTSPGSPSRPGGQGTSFHRTHMRVCCMVALIRGEEASLPRSGRVFYALSLPPCSHRDMLPFGETSGRDCICSPSWASLMPPTSPRCSAHEQTWHQTSLTGALIET